MSKKSSTEANFIYFFFYVLLFSLTNKVFVSYPKCPDLAPISIISSSDIILFSVGGVSTTETERQSPTSDIWAKIARPCRRRCISSAQVAASSAGCHRGGALLRKHADLAVYAAAFALSRKASNKRRAHMSRLVMAGADQVQTNGEYFRRCRSRGVSGATGGRSEGGRGGSPAPDAAGICLLFFFFFSWSVRVK